MENLEISVQVEASLDAGLFVLKGAIDVFSYKELKDAFDRWTKESFKSALLVDMSGVSYVGSSGWSVLFLQTAAQEKESGCLILFGMGERVERALNIIMPRKRHVSVAPDFESAKHLLETLRTSAPSSQPQ
jgi:anti-anti-sigma factor